MEEKQPEMRRFNMKNGNVRDFTAWCDRKGLSRNDLIFILTSVELNLAAFPQRTLSAIQKAYPPDE